MIEIYAAFVTNHVVTYIQIKFHKFRHPTETILHFAYGILMFQPANHYSRNWKRMLL